MTATPRSKVVLVGAGYFAQYHVDAWKRLRDVDLVAIADSDVTRADSFAQQFGVPRHYQSVERMLDAEQPDLMDIVTRPEAHLQLVQLAASRGVHAICQKPMAPSWDECVQMVEACTQSGVRLFLHETWRWQPWYREIHKIIASGKLCRPLQFNFQWRTGDGRGLLPYSAQPYFREMPRLLIYESLIHILDTFRFLGGEIASVHCRLLRANPAIRGEDHAVISLQFASGALGFIDGNRLSGGTLSSVAMGTCQIHGDLAQIRMADDGHLWLTEFGKEEVAHPVSIPRTGYKGDSVFATQRHLIDCWKAKTASESDGRDYLATMQAVFACYQSSERDQAIRLDPLH